MEENKEAPKRRQRRSPKGEFGEVVPTELPLANEKLDYKVKPKINSSADAGKYSKKPKVRPTFGCARTIEH